MPRKRYPSAGGVTFEANQPRRRRPGAGQQRGTDLTTGFPPPFTFDPSIAAEQEALERGLEDLLLDTSRERRFARQDTRQTLHDLRRDRKRGMQDIRREVGRGQRDIGLRREDVQQESERGRSDIESQAQRGREDYSTRLGNLISDFQQQGVQQQETANASGTLGGSTQLASAAARAQNLARARQPLDTGLQRLEEDRSTSLGRLDEDTASALHRLGLTESDLLQDASRSGRRLRQDVRHDRKLALRDLNRLMRDIKIRRQRGRREAVIGSADLASQAAYQAHELHPGAVPNPREPRKRRRKNR